MAEDDDEAEAGSPRSQVAAQEEVMPVHKVKGGYRWGKHGKVYKSRAKAAAQGRAAYANGYRGKSGSKAK